MPLCGTGRSAQEGVTELNGCKRGVAFGEKGVVFANKAMFFGIESR
jgi:hypothetical protein